MKKRILIISIWVIWANVAFCAKTQPDAVYHLIKKEYKINPDGSMDYHFRKEMQLFSHDAFFNRYGETLIPYNTEFQTLTINEAYTIRKDGSKVETPANAFNPSLPSGCTLCERFNNIREMVVTHTALEYDATIVLDYTIHTVPMFISSLMETIDLYESVPIEKYEVSVTLPHFLNLMYKLNYYGVSLEPVKAKGQDSTYTFHWTFTELPQKPSDKNLPRGYLPDLNLTTFASPADFVENWGFQNSFAVDNHDFCKTQVSNLTAGLKTDLDKVFVIRHYVHDVIHTNEVPLQRMNYIVASPSLVWKTNCGTRLEKDLLLTTMLKAAGIRAEFGILYEYLMKDPESAVRIMVDGEEFFITSSSESEYSLSVDKAGDSFISMRGEIVPFKMENTNVEVSAKVNVIVKDGNAMADVQVDKSEIRSPKAMTMKASEPNVARTRIEKLGNGYFALEVSNGYYGCPVKSFDIQRNRQLPVAVSPVQESYSYTIRLPANARCITQPYHIEKQADFGRMIVEMFQNGNAITMVRSLALDENFIEGKKQIRQLREMLSEWNAEKKLVFQCK